MQNTKGFSFIEAIIALTIFALLASASLPPLSTFHAHLRAEMACRELIHALALARSEAIKRNVRVTLGKNSEHWEDGWILFVDANNNTVHDPEELTLLVNSSEKRWITMSGNKGVENFVSYVPAGNTAQANNAWQAGTFTICPFYPTMHGYKIIINRGGRVRQEIADCETSAHSL